MAEASTAVEVKNPMVDHISCSVCFEIYRNPHVLKQCLHTFCLPCIHHLKEGPIVQCPECREATHISDIKKDFKTQGFIDLYNQQICASKKQDVSNDIISLTPSSEGHDCEMCKITGKIVKSKCLTCDQLMCNECERTHTGMKICSDHKIVTVKNILQKLKVKLKSNLGYLETEKLSLGKSASQIESTIEDIRQQEERQLKEVNKYKQERIKKLEDHYSELSNTIKQANGDVIENLKHNLNKIRQLEHAIDDNVHFGSEVNDSEDGFNLLKEAVQSTEKIMQKLKNEPPAVFRDKMMSPVVIEEGDEWDPDKNTQIRVLSFDILSNTNATAVNFGNLNQCLFKEDKREDLGFYPQRLRLIDGKLYVVDFKGGSLHVYNKNCDYLDTLSHASMQYPRSMTKTCNGQIMVACDSDGLVQLDSNLSGQSHITSGIFSDVWACGEKLYALERKYCKLIEFALNGNNKWKEVRSTKLAYKEGHYWDRVALGPSGIYITSCKSNAIFVYSYDGKLMKKHIFQDSNNTGNKSSTVNGIVLCYVDVNENILIADWNNNNLQVCSLNNGSAKNVVLSSLKGIRRPLDVVIDSESRYLWVLENSGTICAKNTLKRFKIKQTSKKQVHRQSYSS